MHGGRPALRMTTNPSIFGQKTILLLPYWAMMGPWMSAMTFTQLDRKRTRRTSRPAPPFELLFIFFSWNMQKIYEVLQLFVREENRSKKKSL